MKLNVNKMKSLNQIYLQVKTRQYMLLFVGILLMTASHMSFGIDILVWIAYVPFLLYLNQTKGWKSRILFIAALISAWSLVVFKIVTPPIPIAMIFLFSIPISLFHLPGYLFHSWFKDKSYSLLLFPSIMVLMEWIQYTLTPFAGWGAAAYSQVNSLAVMQSVSIFGVPGLSFIIYLVNSFITTIISERRTTPLTLGIPLVLLTVLLIFGNLRLGISRSRGIDTIKVAAVGTDSDISGLPLPSSNDNEQVINDLFERTRIASSSGAKLIVWNEASFFTLPVDEKNITNRLQHLADSLNINLVASYIVPVSTAPLLYNNKYLMIDPNGKMLYTYHKHEPVPGEPANKGKEQLKVINIDGANVGGAICYDYDFPYLAKKFGNLDADIVALPSSDWRGIDPLHTQIAAFRAIEQGHSVVRSTRFGLSAAISHHGEMLSQMSSFNNSSKIMIAEIPLEGVTTVYSLIGDVFVLLIVAFLMMFFYISYKGKEQSFNSTLKREMVEVRNTELIGTN